MQGPGCSVQHGLMPVEEEPRRCTLGRERGTGRERERGGGDGGRGLIWQTSRLV